MRYITFALAKGRLAKKAMELLEQTGITCQEMKDESSRKLIFVNEEKKLKAGLFASAPRFAFLDYHFMETVPDRQVLSGAFDTLPMQWRHISVHHLLLMLQMM